MERKSKSDAYGTIGGGRKRFVRELERMAEMDYACIVIECSLEAFLRQPFRSRLKPNSAINSLIAWSVRYGIPIWFTDRRINGHAVTLRILEKFWKDYNK